MKKFKSAWFIIALIAFVTAGRLYWISKLSHAAQVISAGQASMHEGQLAVVEGEVSKVFVSKKGDILLDMDGDYPENKFTVVIFKDYASLFPDIKSFERKKIQVKGTIKPYRGKPEIIVRDSNQIRLSP